MKLSTQPLDLVVTIDGEAFKMRDPRCLEFYEARDIRRAYEQLWALEAIEQPTADQRQQHTAISLRVCALILCAPASVLARLLPGDQHELLSQFIAHMPSTDAAPGPIDTHVH